MINFLLNKEKAQKNEYRNSCMDKAIAFSISIKKKLKTLSIEIRERFVVHKKLIEPQTMIIKKGITKKSVLKNTL